MSKGLGSLQRKIIETSTATQTIWEASPGGVRFTVADTTEKTAHGVTTLPKNGFTFRKTHEPYFCAETVIHSLAEYLDLKRAFRFVTLTHRTITDSMLPACISMHHLRATLWPDLWQEGDNREDLPRPTAPHFRFPQIPSDVKRGRNAAQAGLSRALLSMESRGLSIYAGCTHSAAASVMWKSHGNSSGFHVCHLVLSHDLLSLTARP